MRALAGLAAMVLAMALSGCLPPPAPPIEGESNACTPFEDASVNKASASISGENALAFVAMLVCREGEGGLEPRYRVPGTEGQTEGATLLHELLGGYGFNASYQNLTGAEYDAIPKPASLTPYTGGSYCSGDERDRMLALSFSNVVGQKGGNASGILILLAHFDSKLAANRDPDPELRDEPVLGANDGASGIGVLLELARHWQFHPVPLEIRILFTDGEDGFDDCHPLAGSLAYATSLTEAERNRVEGVLLLDMVGNSSVPFMISGNSEPLRSRLRQAAAEVGAESIASAGSGVVVDDHTPFMEEGLPAIDLIPAQFSVQDYWHTTHDVPDRLSAEFLGQVAETVDRFVVLSGPS